MGNSRNNKQQASVPETNVVKDETNTLTDDQLLDQMIKEEEDANATGDSKVMPIDPNDNTVVNSITEEDAIDATLNHDNLIPADTVNKYLGDGEGIVEGKARSIDNTEDVKTPEEGVIDDDVEKLDTGSTPEDGDLGDGTQKDDDDDETDEEPSDIDELIKEAKTRAEKIHLNSIKVLMLKKYENTSNISLNDYYNANYVNVNNFSKTELMKGEEIIEFMITKKPAILKLSNDKNATSFISLILGLEKTGLRSLTWEQKYNCCFLLAKSHNLPVLNELYSKIL